MCRFLMLRASEPGASFETAELVRQFRDRCEHSREFQGHGWGAAFKANDRWHRTKSLLPIWQDEPAIPNRLDFLILHARSAFRDEGIEIQNNMPFYREERIFVFNGELRGVRLRLPGRIGAEKIFHLIERQNRGHLGEVLEEVDAILAAKSQYVRALNVGLTDGERIHAWCRYNESPEYFTLHYLDGVDGADGLQGSVRGVSSDALGPGWKRMTNGERKSL